MSFNIGHFLSQQNAEVMKAPSLRGSVWFAQWVYLIRDDKVQVLLWPQLSLHCRYFSSLCLPLLIYFLQQQFSLIDWLVESCICVYAASRCSVTSTRRSSLSDACLCTSVNVCMCVCVQRFASQDFLPPEFQHLVLSGARLCPGLMVKLLLWPLTSRLTTNHDGVEWTCPSWIGVSAAIPLTNGSGWSTGKANWPQHSKAT